MCGIVGIVAAPGQPLAEESVGRAMNAAIVHRGPDDEGIYRDEQAMIGMRRLSIIDLAGGHQPLHGAGGQVQVVFNGEIYNYRELRAELEQRGCRFATQSDTEVIVHGYLEFGERCFERLHGMFAIAIWDARSRTLLLARDRFGEKPLFYDDDGRRLAFASELKSLLQVPGFRREIDADAVQSYLCFGYVPAPASIFAGVRKLPPAHYLRYAGGRCSLHRYWTLEFGQRAGLSEADAENELESLLEQAVSSRLVADVPFGAFLSGGLDSSVVVALMARQMNRPVSTFSIGFREDAFNELSDARRVAQHFGTDHHEFIVEPDAVELFEKLVWHLDEPFADSSAIPTYLVAQLARRSVKMVLTGDGGDEALAGYDRYLRYLRLRRLGAARPLAALAARAGGHLLPGSRGYRLRRIGERLAQTFPDDYLSGVALTRADTAAALLGRAEPDHYRGLDAILREVPDGDPLDRIVAIDLHSYLPDDILVKLDRTAMANSLEGRAPLLDHRLVEFAVRLPHELRVRDGRGKYLLRKVAERWLPPAQLSKPKQGFAIPLADWFRGDLRELAADVIGSRAFRERGLLDANVAAAHLAAHVAGDADHGEILWSIVSLESWARRFLDGVVPA
ncbi:asparagine synthase (glutamine-hydrolyzing) [Dokdonella ginsengisoli]|uniref:asparagine synthase (glutamine-hydrolyzing) n=1 Tax=Dokdonella ginsengisoli TaxID=363846 RepID=A0ABV9QQU0_9GAMM